MAPSRDSPDDNPFAAPVESSSPQVRSGRRAPAFAFVQLAFQFKLLSGILLLFGLPFLLGGVWIGLILVATAVGFFVTGYGIGSYKPWGWYAGALLVVPLLVIITFLALIAVFTRGLLAVAAVVLVPPYCYYIVWTLFSRAGRTRYQDSVRAMAAAKENPDSVAGRLYRKKIRR